MDWANLGGSILGGISNLISGVSSATMQQKQFEHDKYINQQNIAFQQQTNEQNKQFAKDMWNMQNAYNDPSQVMARAKNAGINPYAVVGGATTPASPVATPSTQAPHMQNERLPTGGVDIAKALGSFAPLMQQWKQGEATRANTDADTAYKEISAQSSEEDVKHKQFMNRMSEIDAMNYPEWKAQEMKQRELENHSRALKNTFQETENSWQLPKISMALDIDQKTLDKMDNDIAISIKNSKIADYNAKTNRMTALSNIKVANEQMQLIKANVDKVNQETRNLLTSNGILSANVDKAIYEGLMLKQKFNNYVQLGNSKETAERDYIQAQLQLLKNLSAGKVTQQQLQNYLLQIEAIEKSATAPANIIKSYAPTKNNTTTSQTRYDKNGNYNGETVTRKTNH